MDKEVSIKKIIQWHTYGGLLEGMPTIKMNNSILSETKKEAIKFCGFKEIYILEPIQTPIPYEGKYRFGEPAELPGITCIAELWYCFPCRNKKKDFSSLGIVWFQSEYAFPINNEILNKIKEIPFSKICGEFTY